MFTQMFAKTYSVILAAGDYPHHPHALSLLHGAERVVCCDGAAAEYIQREQRVPDVIIGDGDSLSADLKEQYADRFIHIAEQETNDLSKAVRYLQSQGHTTIAILGATGKREDHTLGNISLLVDYLKQGLQVSMFTDHGYFLPVHNEVMLQDLAPATQVSIINFGASELYSEDLRYPLRDFDNWWQGTLNETLSDTLHIQAKGYYLLFVKYIT